MGSVANEQEHRRFSVSAEIEEKALREIYLRPFEMLVKSDCPPACIMTAYNRVNSRHVDMHEKLIKGVLRDEWGYQGLVMSDWGGTNSTVESVLAGCDLEMPGPPLRRGRKLLEALNTSQDGELEAAVDTSCARLLKLAQRLGKLGMRAPDAEASRHRPETTATSQDDIATLRRIAASGMVLLKNEKGVLPLDLEALEGTKIAFIGPSAVKGASNGGGSAAMNPQYLSQPLESFRRGLAHKNINAFVETAPGCRMDKWLPLLSKETWNAPSESNDLLAVDFFSSIDCTGPIVERQLRESSNVDLFDSGPSSLRDSGKPYSLRLTSTLIPETSGSHSFGISSVGNAKLYIDNELVLDNTDWQGLREAFYAFGSPEARIVTPMQAGRPYKITLESCSKPGSTDSQDCSSEETADSMHVYGAQPSVRLGFMEEDRSSISEAVELARDSDLVVVVIGLSEEWESEGYDRQTMDLPGKQDELVRSLLDSVSRPESIIVVSQSGSPVHMPWHDGAPTILQAWYGGQEAGNALADVLLGNTSPNGRLPMTWPRAYTDLPFANDISSWPGVDDVVTYKECTRVGYRWFLDAGVEPLWWFGHGLSYSTFAHAITAIATFEDRWIVTVQVTNTGSFPAEEVVQVYAWPSQQPKLQSLAAFERTTLMQPGDEQTVEVEIRLRDIGQWVDGGWVLPGGAYTVASARHAGDKEMAMKNVTVGPIYP
jgi:beta-glucosidase